MNAIAYFHPNMFKITGQVKFHQCSIKNKTKIRFELKGFDNDKPKGIHIHTYGDLSNGCTSACDHYNPYNTLHGSYKLYGDDRHVGDIINNVTPKNGVFVYEYEDELVDLLGDNSVLGRMVVIHEKEDDGGKYRETNKESATTGNAGKRIACAIIGLTKVEHF